MHDTTAPAGTRDSRGGAQEGQAHRLKPAITPSCTATVDSGAPEQGNHVKQELNAAQEHPLHRAHLLKGDAPDSCHTLQEVPGGRQGPSLPAGTQGVQGAVGQVPGGAKPCSRSKDSVRSCQSLGPTLDEAAKLKIK